jgi:leucyl-tRNA synthetase
MTQTRESDQVEGRIERYDAPAIEAKWQQRWQEDELYKARDDDPRPKYFFLTMYPYPSGDLHTGHWYAETPPDTKARYLRMKGYNVLFPYGFDAFGLPAENAAIKNNVHPLKWTMENIERMRQQAKRMGTMFDWSREVITCLPEYYRWNQWFFLQFLKRGLAYRQKAAVDWCPNCNTTLAREQVWGDDRHCERCGTPVVKRDLEQWFFRITAYAEELLNFEGLDWPDRVKAMQTNWIGRSEGANITFSLGIPKTPLKGQTGPSTQNAGAAASLGAPQTPLKGQTGPSTQNAGAAAATANGISVFTTRPDTIYGVTFMVLAPEHELVEVLTTEERRSEVEAYVEQARRQTEIERTATDKAKTGVFTGSYCVNPYNGEQVPIYVGDYVLAGYGTGAVMGVPAHDQRDFEFAQKYGIEIKLVIAPPDYDGSALSEAYVEAGTMVNSGPFDGTPNEQGKSAVVAYGAERGFASKAITYRLRDWLVSRQRYWGTPIPIIYCPDHGAVPVPEEDLPVLLPEDAEFLPTGESPLKQHEAFRHVPCPICGKDSERETDTMDTFVDSSWYQYRYLSPHFDEAPFDASKRDWLPVSQYTGGIEHATMHLMYFRFFTKAMRDLGLIDFDEPAANLFNQGIILGPDGEKMSKSRGNVVNPDDYVSSYGADTFRCYLMFIGPWSDGGPYRPEGIEGLSRWLNRAWSLALQPPASMTADEEAVRELERQRHRTISIVTDDIEAFRFNTMLARLMEYTSYLGKVREAGNVGRTAWNQAVETLLLLMAPAAPHIAEELWQRTGHAYSVHQQSWPIADAALAKSETFTLVVQVNGKVRDKFDVPVEIGEAEARALALASPRVQAQIEGKSIDRVLFVPRRLVNIVVR